MTLVLGACFAEAVVLAADSRITVYTVDKTTGAISIGNDSDRKLFKVGRAGIATYGSGPPSVHVPTVIESARLEPQTNVGEVIRWLQARFLDAPDMHALVGGLNEHGTLALYDVHLGGAKAEQILPALGATSAFASRGVENVDQGGPATPAEAINKMMELLAAKSGPGVGPPYEVLVILRTELTP